MFFMIANMCFHDGERGSGYGFLTAGVIATLIAVGITVWIIASSAAIAKCPKCASVRVAGLSEKERGERGLPSFAVSGYGKCLDCGEAWAVPVPLWILLGTLIFGLLLTSCFFLIGGYGGATLGGFGVMVVIGCARQLGGRKRSES